MPGVLGPRAMEALTKIQATLGLDYAGIDFGLSSAGDLLLFETNARSEERRVGSDWSSDVCSSDLTSRHGGAHQNPSDPRPGLCGHRFRIEFRRRSFALRNQRQIGRASCRE